MGLQIEKLTVSLQSKKILQGIDLTVRQGEFLSLLGVSGCGKSTLLKCISGFIEPDQGKICMDNEVINDILPEHRGTVMVFQDLRLFPHMTVGENIAFPMKLKKIPKEEQKKKVEQLLSEVQLSGYENHKVREISGGQMQRVALARALAAKPKILLLDEPFSGLDESLRRDMRMLLKKLQREKHLSTILVTHDSAEALELSDRIAIMKEGKILQCDTPQRIYLEPISREAAEYFGKVNVVDEKLVRPSELKLKSNGTYTVKDVIFKGDFVEITLSDQEIIYYSQMTNGDFRKMKIEIGDKVGITVEKTDYI